MKFVLLVFLFVSTEGRRSVFYLCCERGVCLTMSEYQTDFGFDQPTVRRLERGEGGILSQLEGLDRLDVTFSSAFTAEKETDRPVARLIHLIWLGSPLASKFLPGIRSFVTLNPGEWADTFGPELKWGFVGRLSGFAVARPSREWQQCFPGASTDCTGCQQTTLWYEGSPRKVSNSEIFTI